MNQGQSYEPRARPTWRYLSCMAAGLPVMTSEADLRAAAADFSPSAAMTCSKCCTTVHCRTAAHLSPGLSCCFSLCSHGSLQLHWQTDIFALIIMQYLSNIIFTSPHAPPSPPRGLSPHPEWSPYSERSAPSQTTPRPGTWCQEHFLKQNFFIVIHYAIIFHLSVVAASRWVECL